MFLPTIDMGVQCTHGESPGRILDNHNPGDNFIVTAVNGDHVSLKDVLSGSESPFSWCPQWLQVVKTSTKATPSKASSKTPSKSIQKKTISMDRKTVETVLDKLYVDGSFNRVSSPSDVFIVSTPVVVDKLGYSSISQLDDVVKELKKMNTPVPLDWNSANGNHFMVTEILDTHISVILTNPPTVASVLSKAQSTADADERMRLSIEAIHKRGGLKKHSWGDEEAYLVKEPVQYPTGEPGDIIIYSPTGDGWGTNARTGMQSSPWGGAGAKVEKFNVPLPFVAPAPIKTQYSMPISGVLPSSTKNRTPNVKVPKQLVIDAIVVYCTARERQFRDEYPTHPTDLMRKYGFIEGGKYFKVWNQSGTNDQSRSVDIFVDIETGDVYKAAGWKAPAEGIRGNIIDWMNMRGSQPSIPAPAPASVSTPAPAPPTTPSTSIPAPSTTLPAPTIGKFLGYGFSVRKTAHTKTGKPIWVVKFDKIPENDYYKISVEIRKHGGFYNKRPWSAFVFESEPEFLWK
jgi:hypothetical protein